MHVVVLFFELQSCRVADELRFVGNTVVDVQDDDDGGGVQVIGKWSSIGDVAAERSAAIGALREERRWTVRLFGCWRRCRENCAAVGHLRLYLSGVVGGGGGFFEALERTEQQATSCCCRVSTCAQHEICVAGM